MNSQPKLYDYNEPGLELGQRKPVSILAVGDPEEWVEQGNQPPRDGGLAFVSFEQLSEALLEHLSPSVVCSPVLARAFDCIDLAAVLNNFGLAGSYRAVSKEVPNPKVIEREVKQLFPRLDFQILAEN